MPEEATAVTSRAALGATLDGAGDGVGPPCLGCGLRNPHGRRSCLACGAPLGGHDASNSLPIDPPLLERAGETATLDALVERFVRDRQGAVAVVAAPRCAGSTRLLRHAVERLLAAGGVRIFSTTVRDADAHFAPVTRLLWERFGVVPAKGLQAARSDIVAEVHRVLGSSAGPPAEHARRVVAAAGLPDEGADRWDRGDEGALPQLAESLARFFALDAEAQPIALMVDHVDAAPEEGLALFRGILAALGPAPVLVVVAGATGVVERLASPGATVISPPPLSPAACSALCRHLLPGVPAVPPELVAAVVRRAGGAPGRVREILLALLESRVVVTDEVPWRVDLDALGGSGPVSTADLLEVRVARLDAEARRALERAAVVGEVFWEGAVVAMTRIEEESGGPFTEDPVRPAVRDALRRLVAAELIAPIEDSELAFEREYAFTVNGLRELVLRDQPDAVRAPRHDVCAAWMELAAGPRADELSRAIAGHLERAGLREAAARAYLRAARAARASYRGPLAVQLFDKALGFLAAGDAPTRIDALHDKGGVLSLLGRVDEATEAFGQMAALAHRFGARNKLAAALGRLGRLARGRGDMDEARVLLRRALELFRKADDQKGVAAVQDDLGVLAFLAGDFDAALAHSREALQLRRDLDDPLGEALSNHNLGKVHFARGQPRQARAHFERALVLREQHADVEGTVVTRNALACLAYERGDAAQAEKIWAEILEVAEALGDRRMIVTVTHNLGEAAIRRGDATRASQLFDAAEDFARQLGDRRALAEIERSRGTLAREAGDATRARAHLERSLAIARAVGVREAEALALRGLGEVGAMTVFDHDRDAVREADAFFREAIKLLEELGATRELARTRAAFGRYLLERGDVMDGRRVLTQAVTVLERLELPEAAATRAALKAAGGELLIPGG